ncbi:MAG TPA: type II toxin-antitoxin system HicA family toxin [Stellaceae bacterium]
MNSPPSVNAARLIRALERAGFFVHHATGGHYVLKHPDRPAVRIVVPHLGGASKASFARSCAKPASPLTN